MTELVTDASVAIKWVVGGERFRHKAKQLLADAKASKTRLIGPPILEYEVESQLQQRLLRRLTTIAAADASLAAYYRVGIEIEDAPGLVVRAREIARRYRQERVYDSLYVALADLRSCEFWTADRRLYEDVNKELGFVNYLADYN